MPNEKDDWKTVENEPSDDWEDVKPTIVRPKKTPLESAISGTADMLTFGFSDELGAGARAAFAAPFKDESFGQLYDTYLDEQRAHKAQAEEDNPGYFLSGNIAGGVIPAVATGGSSAAGPVGRGLRSAYSALMPTAERGVISNLGRGAAAGALAGAGQSNARPSEDAGSLLGDISKGAAMGGATTGLFSALGGVGSYVADKLRPTKIGSFMLGMPEEAAKLYVKNPEAVDNAMTRQQVTQRVLDSIDQLRDDVIGGSKASREILSEEGTRVVGDEISKLANTEASAIRKRSEGVMDDRMKATYNWLKRTARDWKSPTPDDDLVRTLAASRGITEEESRAALQEELTRKFTTNRIKDLVQASRQRVDYKTGRGDISPVDDVVRKRFVSKIDELLKGESPGYAEHMKGVAKDADLLERVSSLAGSPQAMDNLLNRVARERAFFPAQTLGELDKRMGTQTLRDLKLAQAKEAFSKGSAGPGGSRNVNLYKELGREVGEKLRVPFGGSVGALFGASIDKSGPAYGRDLLKKASDIQRMLDRGGFSAPLAKYGDILKKAAARGPAALVTTNQYLMQDPEYRKVMGTSPEP